MRANELYHRITPQDRGWAWIVLAASTLNYGIVMGVSHSSGVQVSEVIKNWDVTSADAALLGSVLIGLMLCIGPVVTVLAMKTSNRITVMVGGLLSAVGMLASSNVKGITALYFTFSVIGGGGSGMVMLQSLVMPNLYFKKYRGFATGVTFAGGGLGMIIVPSLMRELIAHYGWQPSFYIVAGICLNTCVPGALFRPVKLPPKDISRNSSETPGYLRHRESYVVNKLFILSCVSTFIWGLGAYVPVILGTNFYESSGMNGSQVNILLSSFGAGSLVGRLLGGVICNIKRLDKLTIYVVAAIIYGTSIGLFTVIEYFTLYVILASLLGVTYGAFNVAHCVATATIVEPQEIEKALTVSFFINGVATCMGAPLAGALYDLTSSYKWPYLASACIMFLSAAVVAPGFFLKKRSNFTPMTIEVAATTEQEKLSSIVLSTCGKDKDVSQKES